MGPRIREDNEGKGSEIPRLRFASLGMACAGERGGMMGESGNGGWNPDPVGLGGRAVREPPLRERMLSGTGFTPIPRLHEGRLFAGITDREGWVPVCARTTRGRAARFLGSASLRSE